MDATTAAMKRKNFADFLRKSFFSKNFCVLASGGPPGALPGGQRGTLHRDWRYHAVSEGIASDGR